MKRVSINEMGEQPLAQCGWPISSVHGGPRPSTCTLDEPRLLMMMVMNEDLNSWLQNKEHQDICFLSPVLLVRSKYHDFMWYTRLLHSKLNAFWITALS